MEYGQEIYQEMLDNISDGIYLVDIKRRITVWNKSAEKLTGYKASEVLGTSCFENVLVHVNEEGRELCLEGCPLFDTIMDGEERELEVYLHHKKGHRVPVIVTASPIKTSEGQTIGAIELFHLKDGSHDDPEIIGKLKNAALIDPLTGVANSHYIEMKLNAGIDELEALNIPCGLIIAEIDTLDAIDNDHGMDIVKNVLIMVAKTLKGNLKRGDVLGRWDENRFVAILSNTSEEEIATLSKKLRVLVERSFIQHKELDINTTVTVGGTLAYPGDNIDSVFERAEKALENGKHKARNRVYIEYEQDKLQKPSEIITPVPKKKYKGRRKQKNYFDSRTFDIRPGYFVLAAIIAFVLLWIWVLFV